MVVLAAVNIAADEKEIIETVRQLRLATKQMFAERLRRAIRDKQIPPDTDVPALAGALNETGKALACSRSTGYPLSYLLKVYGDLNASEKNTMLKSIIQRIVYEKNFSAQNHKISPDCFSLGVLPRLPKQGE